MVYFRFVLFPVSLIEMTRSVRTQTDVLYMCNIDFVENAPTIRVVKLRNYRRTYANIRMH